MVRTPARIFVRTRPSDHFADQYINIGDDAKSVHISAPRRTGKNGRAAPVSEGASFSFDHILHNATQESVYDITSADIVQAAMHGMNGTIMAYGQTGAGKTFTMFGPGGGARPSADFTARGVVPRAVAQVFHYVSQRPEEQFDVSVSFLEIYNESLSDLLLDDVTVAATTPLVIQEDASGSVTVKGITQRRCNSEADALSCLFHGTSNRMTSGHPLSPQSSRSHCVFSIYVSARSRVQSDGRTISGKVHLVDLAGSERQAKVSDGSASPAAKDSRREAQFINQSLCYLDQVVTALGSPSRDHVPFRQSKLTSFLKDALGGLSRVSLIANIWPVEEHLGECAGTLRFASRMSKVSSDVVPNVAMDSGAQIKALQRQVANLQAELAMQNQLLGRGTVSYSEDLSAVELQDVEMACLNYITDASAEIEFRSLRTIRAALRVMRGLVLQAQSDAGVTNSRTSRPTTVQPNTSVAPGSAATAHVAGTQGDIVSHGISIGSGAAPARNIARPSGVAEPDAGVAADSVIASSPAGKRLGASAISEHAGASTLPQVSSASFAVNSGQPSNEVNASIPERFDKSALFQQWSASFGKEAVNRLTSATHELKRTKQLRQEKAAVHDAATANLSTGVAKLDKIRTAIEVAQAASGSVSDAMVEQRQAAVRELETLKAEVQEASDLLALAAAREEQAEAATTGRRHEAAAAFQRWYQSRRPTENAIGDPELDLDAGEKYDLLVMTKVLDSQPEAAAYVSAMRSNRGQ